MLVVKDFWMAVLAQDEAAIRSFFHENAYVNWHCTNERFTVDEFVRANCEYPGDWAGEIERQETLGDLIITVTHVYTKDKRQSFHAVSFIKTEGDKILSIDEYWGDDGQAPFWRLEKQIGKSIDKLTSFDS